MDGFGLGNCYITGYKSGRSSAVGLPRVNPQLLKLCYINKQSSTRFLKIPTVDQTLSFSNRVRHSPCEIAGNKGGLAGCLGGPGLTCSCLWQALPSFQIPVSPHIYTSISWAAAPSTASSLSPVSVTVSEPKGPPAGASPRLFCMLPVLEAISPHLPSAPKFPEGLHALLPLPRPP